MLRVKSFLYALSWGMKPGFIIMKQIPNDNSYNGDILSCQDKVQVGTLCWKTYADIVLGYEWTNSQTLSGERRDRILEHCQEKGETVNSVRYSTVLEEELKPAFAVLIAGFYPKASSFSMTVCNHTPLLQQLPPSRN
jgi:hypothetical protein